MTHRQRERKLSELKELFEDNPDLSKETLERLLKESTPGPWKEGMAFNKDAGEDGTLGVQGARTQPGFCGAVVCLIAERQKITGEDITNAKLIALAPTMARLLLERMKAEEWTSVEESLPDWDGIRDYECVRVRGPKIEVWVREADAYFWYECDAIFDGVNFWSPRGEAITENVTHWMRPLPAPPSTLEQKGRK